MKSFQKNSNSSK